MHLASPFVLGSGRARLPTVAVYQTDMPGYARVYGTGPLGEAAARRWLRRIHNAADRIRALGARVAVFDPGAMDRAKRAHPELDYAGFVLGAAEGADVLLLLTGWPEFSAADPGTLGKAVARRTIVDARHALDADAWRDCGWNYRAPGRPSHPVRRTCPS